MNVKNDLAYLEKLFEANLGPIRKDIEDIKKAQQLPMRDFEAHSRIDKWENRGWGFVTAATLLASSVAFVGMTGLKKLGALLS